MSFLLSHLPCFLSLPLHGFIWEPVVQKVSQVPAQIPKPRTLQTWVQPLLCCCFWAHGFTVFSFPASVKGAPHTSVQEINRKKFLFVHCIWIPEWELDNIFEVFSNYNFTKMLLSSETQTQCGKLKDKTLEYVEMLKTSDCTEWFSFWISRISHASLWIDLGLILRYKFFVTSKPRLF